MATGYVSGTTAINPVDSLSKSLNNLSGMFANKAAVEVSKEKDASALLQRRNENAENRRRFELGQVRADRIEAENNRRNLLSEKRAQTKDERLANEYNAQRDLGSFISNGGLSNPVYKLEHNIPMIQERILGETKRITDGKKSFEEFLAPGSNKTIESAMKDFKNNFVSTGSDYEDELEIFNRKNEMLALKNELRFIKDPKQRESIVADASHNLYGKSLIKLNDDVARGKYLTAEERKNATLSAMPKNILEYLDVNDVRNTIGNSLGGMARDEIITRERQATKDRNDANRLSYSTYGKSLSKSYSSGSIKPADFKALRDFENNIDIGPVDNPKAHRAISKMRELGYHPQAIIEAVNSNLDRGGLVGTGFIDEQSDPEKYKNMMNTAKTISKRMPGYSDPDGPSRSRPGLNVGVDRTVDQVRVAMFDRYKAGRVGQFIPENNRQTSLDRSLLPAATGDSRTAEEIEQNRKVAANPEKYGNTVFLNEDGVPQSDGYRPSFEEAQEVDRKQEEYDRLSSLLSRTGRDVVDGISSLPANSAVAGVNLLRAGNVAKNIVKGTPLESRVAAKVAAREVPRSSRQVDSAANSAARRIAAQESALARSVKPRLRTNPEGGKPVVRTNEVYTNFQNKLKAYKNSK